MKHIPCSPGFRFFALAALLLNAACAGKPLPDATDARPAGGAPVRGAALYRTHCASCHGAERLGLMGPALIPDTLGKLKKAEALKLITEGRPATQMPAFRDRLPRAELEAVTEFLYEPVEGDFEWTNAQISASRAVLAEPAELKNRPVFRADPLNLFFVVSHGDRGLTVLDGDRFEPLTQFTMRPGLHGGVKYTPDGRHAFTVTRDGWVTKFDVWNLKKTAEVRAGLNARNIAVSADGRWIAVANSLPRNLVLLNARNLEVAAILPLDNGQGKLSRASAVYTAAPRKSFIVALKDNPELWEVGYSRGGNGFPVRRVLLDRTLDDFFFDRDYRHVLGAGRSGPGALVVDLDRGRVKSRIELPGMPHLGSGILWKQKESFIMATPNIQEGTVTAIRTGDWTIQEKIPTRGPGFFLRSHEKTPYAWVDNFMSKDFKDTVQIIDKRTLKVVRELRPYPGKVTAHVEFTRDGSHALLSVWDDEGALLVYDAKTFELVREIPMKKPSGKYNIWNKTRLSEGTSH